MLVDKIDQTESGASDFSLTSQPMSSCDFPDLIYFKALRALAPPGDAVGLIAAQVSILNV